MLVRSVSRLRDLARALEAMARTGRHYVGPHRLRPVRPALGHGRAGFTWTTSWHAMPVAVMTLAICIGYAGLAIVERPRSRMVGSGIG